MNPRVHRSRVTHDRWLVSYADFITLLFAFFVVLYAFAKDDRKKQSDVSGAIEGAFRSMGVFSSNGQSATRPGKSPTANDAAEFPIDAVMAQEVLSPRRVQDNLEHIQRDLEQKLAGAIAHHTVSIRMGRDGLVISLREAGFFDSGSAAPRAETLDTLKPIAASVGQTPYDVRVEGHTDNIPIHTDDFDSNWELSSARATRIARLMLALHDIPANRLSAAGYAEFHPVDTNATPEGRARNRRVDLVILPRSNIDLAAGPAQRGGTWARITDN
jgi:chemotaxis protein MotB